MAEQNRSKRPAGTNTDTSGNIVEVELKNPIHGGAVVGRDAADNLFFVRGGAPGEIVRATVTAAHRRFAWANATEILTPSPGRVTTSFHPGADLAHLNMDAQRDWKSRVLNDQLRRVGGKILAERVASLSGDEGIPVEPTPGDREAGVAQWGRRTRAEYKVMRTGELGAPLYRSHDLYPVKDDPLVDEVFARSGVFSDPQWRELWKPGDTVRLVAPTASEPVVVIGEKAFSLDRTRVSKNATWRVETTFGTRLFEVDASGFWQTHVEAPSVLVEAVLGAAGDLRGVGVMELYAGAGLFTAHLSCHAGPGGMVVSLEGNDRAVANASENIPSDPDCAPVQLFVGRVDADSVVDLYEELGRTRPLTVLDPPRKGAGRQVVEALAKNTDTDRVVLVSCDPAAASRDMGLFLEFGFDLYDLRAFDLFPQTHHFETVALLGR